jgi:TRAP transporter 4TM/12TM fusion protein
MAEYLQISYGAVLVAATIPALLYYFALFMQVDTEAAKLGIAGAPLERLPALFEVLREGWHFLLPFAVIVAGLLAFRMEAETAALLATAVLVVACTVLRYRGRRSTLKEVVAAARSTGSAVLDIVLICAAAGILIGVLNISGLAFGLTIELIGIAGQSLIALLLIAALIGILLGLGLPTVGVYVLMATLVAPALVKLGVAPLAAHMFVMYFGMMSMVTPPIALAAYAAANIAQCDPDRAGWMATRVGWAAYLVPFLFVYSPQLLMQGALQDILWEIVTVSIGLWCGTIAAVGYCSVKLPLWQRALAVAATAALLYPGAGVWSGVILNSVGLAIAFVFLASEHIRSSRR